MYKFTQLSHVLQAFDVGPPHKALTQSRFYRNRKAGYSELIILHASSTQSL